MDRQTDSSEENNNHLSQQAKKKLSPNLHTYCSASMEHVIVKNEYGDRISISFPGKLLIAFLKESCEKKSEYRGF